MRAHFKRHELYESLKGQGIALKTLRKEAKSSHECRVLGTMLWKIVRADLRDGDFFPGEMAAHVQPDFIQILGDRGLVAVRLDVTQQLIDLFHQLAVVGIEFRYGRFKQSRPVDQRQAILPLHGNVVSNAVLASRLGTIKRRIGAIEPAFPAVMAEAKRDADADGYPLRSADARCACRVAQRLGEQQRIPHTGSGQNDDELLPPQRPRMSVSRRMARQDEVTA